MARSEAQQGERKEKSGDISKCHKHSTYYIDLDAKMAVESKGKKGGKRKGKTRTIAKAMAKSLDDNVIDLKLCKGDALVIYQMQEGHCHLPPTP